MKTSCGTILLVVLLIHSSLASTWTDEQPPTDYSSICLNIDHNVQFVEEKRRFKDLPDEDACIEACRARDDCNFYVYWGYLCRLIGFVDSLESRNAELFQVDRAMFEGSAVLAGGCMDFSAIEASTHWTYMLFLHTVNEETKNNCYRECVSSNFNYAAILTYPTTTGEIHYCHCSRFVDGTLTDYGLASEGTEQCDGQANQTYVGYLDKPCEDFRKTYEDDTAYNPVNPIELSQKGTHWLDSLDQLGECYDDCQGPSGNCRVFTVKPKRGRFVCQFFFFLEPASERRTYICPKDGGSIPEATLDPCETVPSTPQPRCLLTQDCQGGLDGELVCDEGYCVQRGSPPNCVLPSTTSTTSSTSSTSSSSTSSTSTIYSSTSDYFFSEPNTEHY